MRILFVSQEMPPETGWGGIGTYVDILSEALAARGHEVHVLSVVPGQRASVRQAGRVTVHRHPLADRPDPTGRLPESWRRLLLAGTVARLVRRLAFQPDIVECPEWMAEGLVLGVRRAVPLVVRLHSSARQLFPISGQGRRARGLDGRLAAWLEETSARAATVVSSTRSNLEEVAGVFGLDSEALHAIPYPVRLPPLAPMDRDSEPRVTFVGRFERRKAPDVVLRAVPLVLRAVPEARFVFVGRDAWLPDAFPGSDWLRGEARRLGIEHAVELTGQLDREGVQDQLRRATVCTFPSQWESFGLVVAEASAVGRPVVVTPIAGFRDLVVDGITGRVIARDDSEGWARALIELLQNRELAARMGAAGARHIAEISDPSRVADLTLAGYEHALDRWRAGLRAGGLIRLRAGSRAKP